MPDSLPPQANYTAWVMLATLIFLILWDVYALLFLPQGSSVSHVAGYLLTESKWSWLVWAVVAGLFAHFIHVGLKCWFGE